MRLVLLGLVLCGCTAAPVVVSPTAQEPASGWDVEPISGLGLFADERARGQELLHAALSARPVRVLPLDVTRRAWKLAAEGRNPLTGAECGRPLYPFEARKRWAQALGITGSVAGYVGCTSDGGCELNVFGRPLDEAAAERLRLAAPIDRNGEALQAVGAALARLGPPPPGKGGGLGMLGGMGGDSPVQEDDRLIVSAWLADARDPAEDDRDRVPFPTLTLQQAEACTGDSMDVLLEVSPAGTIARCEGEGTNASCACGQLQKVAPASWLAGKRWNVSARIDRKDQLTSDRRFVISGYWRTHLVKVDVPGQPYPRFQPKVEDPSIEAWAPGSARLATDCLAGAFTAPGTINSRWAVWFDGAGRPTKVLEQKGFAPLPKQAAVCVTRALTLAQAPCPSRAGLWAMADLSVTARDPNAPQKPLKDLLGP